MEINKHFENQIVDQTYFIHELNNMNTTKIIVAVPFANNTLATATVYVPDMMPVIVPVTQLTSNPVESVIQDTCTSLRYEPVVVVKTIMQMPSLEGLTDEQILHVKPIPTSIEQVELQPYSFTETVAVPMISLQSYYHTELWSILQPTSEKQRNEFIKAVADSLQENNATVFDNTAQTANTSIS